MIRQHVEEAMSATHASVSLNQSVGTDDEGELGDLFADREAANRCSVRRDSQSVVDAADALGEDEAIRLAKEAAARFDNNSATP